MKSVSDVCALALLIALSAWTGIGGAGATSPAPVDDQRKPNVQIKKNHVIINMKPSEIKHSKQFFPKSENCTVEDGLIITLDHGRVAVHLKDRALRGVSMTPAEMVFRIGEPECEISVKIERYIGN